MAPDAFFYVGRTLPVSGETGILVPYPGTSASEILLSHDGNQDIILSLPGDITTSEIKWLSVWCRQFEVSFGDVEFPEAVITIEGKHFTVHLMKLHQLPPNLVLVTICYSIKIN